MSTVSYLDLKPQYLHLKKEIDASIARVLDHGQFIMGPEVTKFEEDMNKFTGCKHSLAVASGTDALMIALMALDLSQGDEVITTPFSFFATAEVIALLGLKPVFVDIDPVTYNLNPAHLKKAITSRTKVICPVSLYGQMGDLDEINAVAKEHNLVVLEDAAQSFGARYKDKRSCAVTTLAATSFFPAKPLGCYGDGGAVFTNNDDLKVKMEQIRSHGQESRYHHVRLGFNGRLDTLQCAILIEKLKRYEWEIEQRQQIAKSYNQAFAEFESKVQIPHVKADRDSVWAQYTLSLDNRTEFIESLKKSGVPTSVHYPEPLHKQPALKNKYAVSGSLAECERAAQRVVSLPLYPDMPQEARDQVIKVVREYFTK